MRNLKKFLAVLVVVVMIATTIVPAFAADSYTYSDQAQKLYDLNLFQGLSDTTYEPGLGLALDRQTGVVMLLRLIGKEAAATAMSDADATAALANFTDKGDVVDWAQKSLAYAVKNGLVEGMSSTLLGPKTNLSGKMYATMILRNLGYTVNDTAYATAAALLAEKGGLTAAQAVTFNDKALIRDDLVGMSFGALQAKYSTGETIIDKLVADGVVTADKAVTAGVLATITALANPADITVIAGGTITLPTTVTATLSDASTKDVTVTWDKTVDAAVIGTTTLTGTVANTTLTAALKVIVNAPAFVVSSVTQLNAGSIKVTFAGNVDINSAQTPTNYKVNGVALNTGGNVFGGTAVALKAAADSVTIYSGVRLENNVSFTLEVNGVQSASFVTAPVYRAVVTGADTTAPAITKVSATAGNSGSTTSVSIEFSEPVLGGAGTYKINGIAATAVAKTGKDGYKVTLTSGQSLSANTEYTLVASAASDGINVAGTTTQNFTVASDITAPQVVSVSQKADKIAVKFDKEISADNSSILAAGTDYKVLKVGDNLNYANAVAKDGDDVNTLLITLGAGNVYGVTGGTTATVELTLKNVKDAKDNLQVGTLTQSMTLTKDSIKPTLVSATVNTSSRNELLVQFSEPVWSATANGTLSVSALKVASAYAVPNTYTDSLVKSDWTAYTATSYSSYIKIALGTALEAGADYKFTVASGSYKDGTGNGNDSFSFIVNVAASADSTKPTATVVGGYNAGSGKNEVTITFSEDVNVSDAINVVNYVLDGAAIPSGTTITNISTSATKSDTFLLVFGASDVATSSTVTLVTSNIRDIAGNTMDSKSQTLAFVDTKKPALTSAAATAKDTIELTFSENLSGTYDTAATNEVVVTDGTNTVNFDFATAAKNIIGSKLIITGPGGTNMTPINFGSARVQIIKEIVADQSAAVKKNDAKDSTANFPIADKFVGSSIIGGDLTIKDLSVNGVVYDKDNYSEIGMYFVENANAVNDGIVSYKIYFVNPNVIAQFQNVSDLNNYTPVMTLNRAQIQTYKSLDAAGQQVALATSFTSISDGRQVSSLNANVSVVVVATDAAGNSAIVYNLDVVGTAIDIAD